MPDETDERFSSRQMTLLLEARNRRNKNHSKQLAYEVWDMVIGNNESQQSTEMVKYTGNKGMAFFGIGKTEGGEK